MDDRSNQVETGFDSFNQASNSAAPSPSGDPLEAGATRELLKITGEPDALDASTPTHRDASNAEVFLEAAEATGGDTSAAPDASNASTPRQEDSTPVNAEMPEQGAPSPAAEDKGRDAISGDRFGEYKWTEFDVPSIGTIHLVKGADGKAYLIEAGHGNPLAHRVGGKMCNEVLQNLANKQGKLLTQKKLAELNAMLRALASTIKVIREVWYRVAPMEGGIMLDVGDEARTQLKVTADGIETIHDMSPVLFRRTSSMRALPALVDEGDLSLLKNHVNLSAEENILLILWMTYTMTRVKRDGTSFVILVIQGDQGSGKTSLCNNIIIPLIDPSIVGVQTFARTAKDIAIIFDNAHVACFDNVRNFKADLSDLLCMVSTGAGLSGRSLYTDSDQHVDRLHGALVINSIHSTVLQPDLGERCLMVYTKSLGSKRKTSTEMAKELLADRPKIFRGLLDVIVAIFGAIQKAVITKPERMIDFVEWAAAYEAAKGLPDVFQQAYSASMKENQHEMLRGNSFAAAILDFADDLKSSVWVGTPQELFVRLSEVYSINQQRSIDWPSNAIGVSKRLNGLKASLLSQGIEVQLSRGKERKITIRVTKPSNGEVSE